jgi:hypothetical protein
VIFTFPLGRGPRSTYDEKLGGPQTQSGCCGKEINHDPAGNRARSSSPKPNTRPIVSLTELPRLLVPQNRNFTFLAFLCRPTKRFHEPFEADVRLNNI